MISYVNLEGVEVNFTKRAETVKNFGSWISIKDDVTPSDIVSWCDKRIETYERWIAECKNFKAQNQEKLIDGLDPEVRTAGLTKEQLKAALKALEEAEG